MDSLIGSLLPLILTGLTGAALSSVILLFSLNAYTRAGPGVSKAVIQRFRKLAMLSVARQWLISTLLLSAMIAYGAVILLGLASWLSIRLPLHSLLALSTAIAMGCLLLRTLSILHENPATIAVNSNTHSRHWLRLQSLLPLPMVKLMEWVLWAGSIISGLRLIWTGEDLLLLPPAIAIMLLQYDLMVSYRGTPKAIKQPRDHSPNQLPNILMIGCDTFRADYMGKVSSRGHSLTPHLDSLCGHATRYTNMVTPIARTAPSLASLFCSEWPSKTRLWDNFTDPKSVNLKSHLHTLAAMGYRTATFSDWAGSDFARYDFGFQERETPADQWNIRYLLGQGAKQYRLFLSLFSAGRFGKKLLPEIHYAAGIPQNRQSTYRFCKAINRYSQEGSPFLLNLFISTAHPPFGSEAPYYNLYSEKRDTSSPFCMVKLTEPEEIIKSQRDPKVAFELDQVISLYEGCISNFDHRVGNIIEHLKRTGLYDDCALVIYSDHGIDFFEKNSWGQGNNLDGLYSNRIPCIIKVPNQPPEVNDSFCSNRDIFPTLLTGLNLIPSKPDKENALDHGSANGTPVDTQFLETGVWITRPPSASDDHLYYPDIDQILDVTDHGTGSIILDQSALKMIDQAKDRAMIHPPWILVRKPCQGGPRWSLYHLLSDPLMEKECSQEQPELLETLKKELNNHFFDSE